MTNQNSKKLRIGWFSFTCCEDSTIIFTELLNDHWREWKKILNIRHARALQTKNVLDDMDVAFIEGALSSQNQIDKVKKIRSLAKIVVAVGSCAVTGMPSGQRNAFTEENIKAIQETYLDKFNYLPKVQKLSEAIKVDFQLAGCPMDPNAFLKLLDKVLIEFKIK